MKIEVEGDIVTFKSDGYFYRLEKSGLKPNTVRLLTKEERRQIKPDEDTYEVEHIKRIRIETNRTLGQSKRKELEPFERKLTSIEQIGELLGRYLYVFSWRHEEEGHVRK